MASDCERAREAHADIEALQTRIDALEARVHPLEWRAPKRWLSFEPLRIEAGGFTSAELRHQDFPAMKAIALHVHAGDSNFGDTPLVLDHLSVASNVIVQGPVRLDSPCGWLPLDFPVHPYLQVRLALQNLSGRPSHAFASLFCADVLRDFRPMGVPRG